GAAPLDAALETACARRLECALIQGYGLTEASPVTHAVSDEPGAARPGTIGRLVPNTECRIVDPASGAQLGPGQDGELLIRGPQVMSGYLNNRDATAATLDAAGWLHTGDIGRVDADGYFTIVDRDRKSTRLNSSHGSISYAVFCLKKKNANSQTQTTSCTVYDKH